MRVAIATETFLPSVDGVVVRLKHTVDWLVAHGHEVCVIAPDLGCSEYLVDIDSVMYSKEDSVALFDGMLDDGRAERPCTERRGATVRVPVLGVPAVTYPFYRSRPWARPSRAVARHLDAFGPDLVHAAQPDILGAQAVRWAVKNGVPLVSSYHTDIEKYVRYYLPTPLAAPAARAVARYERALHDRATVTIVTSEAMRARLEGLGHSGLTVVPRGVDLAARGPRFRSDEMRARLTAGEPDRPLLVYIGRVAAEKNLASLRTLLDAHPDWSLAVVGDGPQRMELELAFAGTHTTFTGFLAGRELSAAFASGDVFVFPSTSETLGLVIAEAQASGVAVLAAASEATREQIRNGIDGLVYQAAAAERAHGDAGREARETSRPTGVQVAHGCAAEKLPGLLEAAELLMADPGLRARLAAGGIEATRDAGWDASGAAIFAAYERAIAMGSKQGNPNTI